MKSSKSLRSKLAALAFIWLAAVTIAVALLVKQWALGDNVPIESDVLKLLPKNQQTPVLEQSFQRISTDMESQVFIVVEAEAEQQKNLFLAVDAFSNKLKRSGYFSLVTSKIDALEQQQWQQFYFKHRFNFLTQEQRKRLQKTPQYQLQEVIQSIYNPFSGVTGLELNNDPFLLFREYLGHLTELSGAFSIQNDYLSIEKEGKRYVLISAELAQSPYSSHTSELLSNIDNWQATLGNQYGVNFYHTGVLFYADFARESAKREISNIGSISLIGIVLLVLLVFRSLFPLILALLSIGVGVLVALAITTWVFGKVHLFSLIFGASLIGISIDYAFHYLTERLVSGSKWDSIENLKCIFPAISFGLITSLIGYWGLLVAPFPGLQQLALFSSIGLIAAYLTVVSWYPYLATKPLVGRELPAVYLWRWWLAQWLRPIVRKGLPAGLILLSALGLTQVYYDDDIRQLQALPKELKANENVINTLTGSFLSPKMLVVVADNNDALLRKLEEIQPKLEILKEKSVFLSYQSLTQYIGSQTQQKNDFTQIKRLYNDYAEELGKLLNSTSTISFNQSFRPISLENYLESAVSKPVRFLYLGKINSQVGAVVLLRGIEDQDELKAYFQQDKSISYLDKADEISSLFYQYRIHIMQILIIALGGIFIFLSLRYGIKHSVNILLPCLIACMSALGVSALTGFPLNIFSLLALVLVIGIGLDYSLFFAEQGRSKSTLLAVSLSAVTTLLSFGLLSLSDTHAIHSFGFTALIGIFVVWLLAPMAIPKLGNVK